MNPIISPFSLGKDISYDVLSWNLHGTEPMSRPQSEAQAGALTWDPFHATGRLQITHNPPWIKIEWIEQDILSDSHPVFAIKSLTAPQVASHRVDALRAHTVKQAYYYEYQAVSGEQAFCNAVQNYNMLRGQQTNLYKCFLPQAWTFSNNMGISAFIHPEGVYDEPRGGKLRRAIYPRLRKHLQFRNELKLFAEIHHSRIYSLNIYSNRFSSNFESINNLFIPATIDECYTVLNFSAGGIKNENGEWNTKGSWDRVLEIGKKELLIFAKMFNDDNEWQGTRLLSLHSKKLLSIADKLASQEYQIGNITSLFITEMWNETTAQKDGTIKRNVGFPESPNALVMAGSQIGVANPLLKTPRKICVKNSDFDTIDLTAISSNYFPRSNYSINCSHYEYNNRTPKLNNKDNYDSKYRIFCRKMIDPEGSRSLVAALIPPRIAHTHGITGIYIEDQHELLLVLACLCSLPIDYMLKATAKANFQSSTIRNIPYINPKSEYAYDLEERILKLNVVTCSYSEIWNNIVGKEWSKDQVYTDDFTRRRALVEIDVLVSMAFGITLDELLTMYQLQFHILKNQENNTWYDANGRIVFTNNRSLTNVGFSRSEWENGIKGAPTGKKFYRTIMDDTMPGGPVERTIEYVAPFDRCDREQDYETAWKFFEEKYGENGN